MRPTKIALTTLVVLTLLVGAVSVAGAQMDDGMDDDGMEDDSMDDTMEDNEMSDGTDSEMDDTDDGMDDGMGDTAATFTVRIENVAATDFYPSDSSTGGQVWVTPGAYAVHTESNPVSTEGESASIGLEAQAEAGPPTGFEGQPGLVDELGDSTNVVTAGAFTPENTVADPNDPTGEVPGAPPIAPGGAYEFEVEATQGQHLSFATMFVPSNDLFFAPGSEGIALWEGGEPVSGDVTDEITLWDAGTETNQEPGFGPDQAPAQSGPDQGDDEGGVVRPISTVDDGFDYPSVSDTIQVTVTPQGEMDDGTGDDMDDGEMEDDNMDDSMEDMEDGTGDDMDGDSMDDDSMENMEDETGDDMNDENTQGDDSMDDENTDNEAEDGMNEEDGETTDGQEEGEGLPGFGVTVTVAAVLLSVVGIYAMRRKQD